MAMTYSAKVLVVGEGKLDRLTDLPIDVIHHIQYYMSIEDAARMSVLSRTWRYIWSSNPTLIFDTNFCTKRVSSKTIDIISTILFQHDGYIKTFSVDISVLRSSDHSVVDRWMLFLSRNGLMNLTIQNQNNSNNAPYKLPSYVYDVGLERLVLSYCIFSPPCRFKGFHKLKLLQLTRVSFELDIVTSSSSILMPSLAMLHLFQCSGLRFLNIHAPKLSYLSISGPGNDPLRLSPFMNSEKMSYFAIASKDEVSLNRQDGSRKFIDILSSWPNLTCLVIFGRRFVKLFASGTEEESPLSRLTSLRELHICEYNFDSEHQIPDLLRILSSFPNLQKLQYHMSGLRKKDDMEVDVNFLQGPVYRTRELNNFRILQVNRFNGSRFELLLIRFILASAPLLQKAILLVDSSVNGSQALAIAKELMRFPRASPKSEIIYEPWSAERAKLKR